VWQRKIFVPCCQVKMVWSLLHLQGFLILHSEIEPEKFIVWRLCCVGVCVGVCVYCDKPKAEIVFGTEACSFILVFLVMKQKDHCNMALVSELGWKVSTGHIVKLLPGWLGHAGMFTNSAAARPQFPDCWWMTWTSTTIQNFSTVR